MSYNITTVMKRLDGSIGESKATFADGEVTFEESDTPSPYITEIKTLNGVSLVGSGDYAFDTTLNENSTNAVQNKVITEYITDLESKTYTKTETDAAIQTAINDAILTALNTAV